MPYSVIFCNDRDGHYTVIAKDLPTVEAAGRARELAGDVVIDENLAIVQDKSWLLEWELKDPTCYAQQKIRNGVKLRFS